MYSIYAILGRSNELDAKPLPFTAAKRIRVGAGLSIVPLSEELVSQIEAARLDAPSGSVSGAFEFLVSGVETWARSLSTDTAIAYVESEFFGGEGFERSVVWSHGAIALGPLEGAGSINQALRALGVQPRAGIDEFEIVGLGRHRTLAEWLQNVD